MANKQMKRYPNPLLFGKMHIKTTIHLPHVWATVSSAGGLHSHLVKLVINPPILLWVSHWWTHAHVYKAAFKQPCVLWPKIRNNKNNHQRGLWADGRVGSTMVCLPTYTSFALMETDVTTYLGILEAAVVLQLPGEGLDGKLWSVLGNFSSVQ